jgi:hypothetical protein
VSLLGAEGGSLALAPVERGTRFTLTLPIVQGRGAISKI